MTRPTRIAVLQMTSGIDPGANFDTIRQAAHRAGRERAAMLFTPEMSLLLDRDRKRAAAHIPAYEAESYVATRWDRDGNRSTKVIEQQVNPFVSMLCELAEEHRVDICLGSMAVARPDGLLANRSMYFPASGERPAAYDKIHMFDVDLAGGESWRESNAYAPGDEVVIVDDTPIGRLGLTVCYDIRFPALFEALGRRRCDAIAIPSAFTVPTGRAHWHLLNRARAVEASAWVIAAAQAGRHADGRETYGHSLVVDPWGEVVLDMGTEPGLGFATIDPARTAEVRAQLPSLANRREIPKSAES